MNRNRNKPDRNERDAGTDEELVGILTAISVVSRRLAWKLALEDERNTKTKERSKKHEQNVGT